MFQWENIIVIIFIHCTLRNFLNSLPFDDFYYYHYSFITVDKTKTNIRKAKICNFNNALRANFGPL